MSRLDAETKRKLREMGAVTLLDALEGQDDDLALGMAFAERVQIAVDQAHAAFTHQKVDGLIRRAGLRYPDADLRTIDLIDERGLDRTKLLALATCEFIERHQNVVFEGFTGSGKSYHDSGSSATGAEIILSGVAESPTVNATAVAPLMSVITAVVDGAMSVSDMVPASFGPLGPISHIW